MGETTCLMQPFSYAAGIPSEANEGNLIHALGQSVSFGRFMSESLAWEKWSTFSHNRYVEEAEKHSRPGSVAQKKAFFEAHYKNLAARKAAALLEQANAAANNASEPEHEVGVHNNTTQVSAIMTTNSQTAVDKQVVVKDTNIEACVVADDNNYKSSIEMDKFESSKSEEVNPSTESQVIVENCAKCEQLGVVNREAQEMEQSETKQMEKPLLKDIISKQDDLVLTSKMKPAVSTSKSSTYSKASKVPSSPAKPAASLRAKKENNATPISKKPAIELVERNKITPKSTKKMNFTPVREINRLTSTIIQKIDSSRLGSSSKASKDCSTPLRTPTTVSMVGEPKHHIATPQSENRRAKTPLHPLASGSKTIRAKWHFLPTDCSKFMNACRNKSQSPNLSTPFSFRTEERAARRKERLEEKFNANQAQKLQFQTTLKEKAEIELKKLRQSLCFKAMPLPDFYKEKIRPKDQMEKSPEAGRKPTSIMLQSTSQLSHRSSIRNSSTKHVVGKKGQKPQSLTSRLKTITCENTSPNVEQ